MKYRLESFIALMSYICAIIVFFLAGFNVFEGILLYILLIVAVFFFVCGLYYSLIIHSGTTHYLCDNCDNVFQVKWYNYLFSIKFLYKRYFRCSICGVKTWCKTVRGNGK